MNISFFPVPLSLFYVPFLGGSCESIGCLLSSVARGIGVGAVFVESMESLPSGNPFGICSSVDIYVCCVELMKKSSLKCMI
jgi:hypothetical protein